MNIIMAFEVRHGPQPLDQIKRPASARVIAMNGSRQLVCARCGATFECRPGGDCWCAEEEFRLPLPEATEDCLCPTCLRAALRVRAGGSKLP